MLAENLNSNANVVAPQKHSADLPAFQSWEEYTNALSTSLNRPTSYFSAYHSITVLATKRTLLLFATTLAHVGEVAMGRSFALHAGLDLAELGLACQKLLALLVDLALDLELDLAKLLLLAAELLLLEADGLRGQILGVHGAVDAVDR